LNNFLALLARFPSFENDPDFDPAFEPDADGSSVSPAGLSSSAGSSSSVVESAAPMLLLFCLPPLGSLDCAASSFFFRSSMTFCCASSLLKLFLLFAGLPPAFWGVDDADSGSG
jgi:hypothetical protein